MLTPEDARKLAAEFPGVKVDIEFAGCKKRRGSGLPLNGLKMLDAEVAKALSTSGKDRDTDSLFLHGLTSLSPEAAQSLAGFNGFELGLCGLATLSGKAVKALRANRGVFSRTRFRSEPEEEDLAFSEKKYQRKINRVKPKRIWLSPKRSTRGKSIE